MTLQRNVDAAHVFSVDVEEYYQVEAYSQVIPRDEWGKYPSRVEDSTCKVLEILDRREVKGTFFVLGYLARQFPDLVKKIFASGHEIASHGYDHSMITTLSRSAFREDIRKSKQILEDIIGTPIGGYRAPTFSIREETSWAYEILQQEGFSYSSSVYPIRHDRYGWPSFGDSPRNMAKEGEGEIWELPMSAATFGALRVPFGGGGYLRIYPFAITKAFFRKFERLGKVGMVYVHPWEFDPEQPEIKAPLLRRLRHRLGIAKMEERLTDLLSAMRFRTAAQYLDAIKNNKKLS